MDKAALDFGTVWEQLEFPWTIPITKVHATVEGNFRVRPEPTHLGLLKVGEAHSETLLITSRSKKPFRLREIRGTPELATEPGGPISGAAPASQLLLKVACTPTEAGLKSPKLTVVLQEVDGAADRPAEELELVFPYEAQQ